MQPAQVRPSALGEDLAFAFHEQRLPLIALDHDAFGCEVEVDWGQADIVLGGVQRTVSVFLMRACFSGACFVIYLDEDGQRQELNSRRLHDGITDLHEQ